jgi:hypothetical protein
MRCFQGDTLCSLRPMLFYLIGSIPAIACPPQIHAPRLIIPGRKLDLLPAVQPESSELADQTSTLCRAVGPSYHNGAGLRWPIEEFEPAG